MEEHKWVNDSLVMRYLRSKEINVSYSITCTQDLQAVLILNIID